MNNQQNKDMKGNTKQNPEIEVALPSDIDIEVDEAGTVSVSPHNDNPHTRRQLIGASITGALAGCLFCGPIFGIPIGAGTAALAVSSKTRPGEWTRTGANFIADTGEKAGKRLQKLDAEKHIVDETKRKAAEGFKWTSKQVKKMDEDYHLIDKTKKGAATSYEWAHKRLEPSDSPRAAFE